MCSEKGWLVGVRGSPDPGTLASLALSGATLPWIKVTVFLKNTVLVELFLWCINRQKVKE